MKGNNLDIGVILYELEGLIFFEKKIISKINVLLILI